MKNKLIIIPALLLFLTGFAYAQETSETPTPTKGTTDKIQELKDRVANRVAALKKEKSGGLSGTVKSTTDGALILIHEGTQYSVQLDEDAKVYSIDSTLKKKEVKLSSIEKDKFVTVIGVIDNNEKTATAKVVVDKEPDVSLSGKVSSVSTKDGTITLISPDNKTYVVDIETTTKVNSYDQQKDSIVKTGLSKIGEEARIHVYGVKGEGENRISAARVLILSKDIKVTPPETPKATPSKSAPTKTPTPTKTPSPTPTG